MIDDVVKVVLLALIEGVTEFLPVSSTGHLIVGAALLNFDAMLPPVFEIFIQVGAVAAVLVYYRRTLREKTIALPSSSETRRFWLMIALASAPVAAIGIIFQQLIESLFFSAHLVAASLIIGGVVILIVERMPRYRSAAVEAPMDVSQVTARQAAMVGLVQILALVPGMSRSGCSIVGGMLAGLSRRVATEFSFFLAIPLLGSATIYKFVTTLDTLGPDQLLLLLLGAAFSGVFSLLAIDLLLKYISRHSFVAFGYYRIAAGAFILLALPSDFIA
ncbi:MAG: undecaprenyl-diphosphate phosphatase [Chloroflexi bacterium]|nr:undecaprenyl-diphosphate phosphatase [Chloroflexota bacterium]MCY3976536.1 undecaprenyl-diphosphate phosphatase [Chloroflexota bacterium]